MTHTYCHPCGWLAFGLSALLHAGLAWALLHWGLPAAPGDSGERPVGLRLEMFAAGPLALEAEVPGAADAAPALAPVPQPQPTPAPEPIPAPEPVPEPDPAPVSEPAPAPGPVPEPEPVPDSAPTPRAPQAPKARPEPKASETRPKPEPKVAAQAPSPDAKGQAETPRAAGRPGAGAADGTPGEAAAHVSAEVEQRYLSALQQAIARHKFYPQAARRGGVEGTVTLGFVIEADGSITGAQVATASGSPLLDEAALETLARLGRFRPIPEELRRERWPLRVPIRFALR